MKFKLPAGFDGKYWLLIGLFFVLLVSLLPRESHSDFWYWNHWTSFCYNYGIGGIYNYRIDGTFPTNYHPFFLHCLNFFAQFQDSIESLRDNLFYIKIFPLLFDFIGALAIFLVVKKSAHNQFLPFFLLFNIAYLYNSLVWGQVDSIFTSFSLLAIIFALKKQPAPVFVFYLLALNTKLQAIIFFPLLGLLLLPSVLQKWRQSLFGLALALLVQVILLWPFYQAATLREMYTALTNGSVDFYPVTSINAFNFWFFFFGTDTVIVKDTEQYLGLSYKIWGLLLFCISSAIALIPLAIRVLRVWVNKTEFDDRSKELAFLAATIIPLAFFFFNTQMHERYSHPALVMAFFYGVFRKNYGLYLLISLAYFLNLEKVLQAFHWKYHTLIFDPVFIAAIFALVIALACFSIFWRHWPAADFRVLWEKWKQRGFVFSGDDNK